MADVDDIVRGLTSNTRAKLAAISLTLGVGDYFRPDEGESHAPYSAMVRADILDKFRLGDMPTFYCLTKLGADIRARLLSSSGATDHAQ